MAYLSQSSTQPERIKRPWLSIIKQLTKKQYTLYKKDYRIYQDDGGIIRTILYTFSKNWINNFI